MASTSTAQLAPRRSLLSRVVRAVMSPFYRFRHAKTIHAVRVGLAMFVSILMTSGIHIPHGIWASVTTLVVIGGLQHHGNIRKKSTDRAAGTMLGATIGLALILQQSFIGSLWVTYVLMSIIAAVCGYYAIGKAGYVALLTAITACIVAGHGDNLIDTGLWRTLNVMIGIVIALAFSFALPLHATYSWRYLIADNLRGCARVLLRVMEGEKFDTETQNRVFIQLGGRLVQARGLMPSVAKEIDVPNARLEEIQRLHRTMLSALEMMVEGALAHADASGRAAFAHQCHPQMREMRASMLEMARALRFSATLEPRTPAPRGGASCEPADDAPTTQLTAAQLGPFWLGERLAEQVGQLRGLLYAIEPNWNIERRIRPPRAGTVGGA
ncbi:FUSC family protein [Paraburkholderia phosphatilytica]|uniref:FUSC family protein n=1 Tax=Paraburkholderia phosphatilytica TaxID=2282883 RepID=UPI000E50D55D|nr:FUSC family protein [Paraburkholderia phosphatilytica]